MTLTEGAARTIGVIRRNIAFSIGYNLIGATLAVTGVITPLDRGGADAGQLADGGARRRG